MAVVEIPHEGAVLDRGTPVTITVIFCDEPTEVYASFIRPKESRAVVDPGYGRAGSRIRRLDECVYTYQIDTTGFAEGKATWHMWGSGDGSGFGWFMINDRPAQLL